MSRIVLLDAGPLGLATSPRPVADATLCKKWIIGLMMGNTRVLIPEIADYEVRRELIRAGKERGVRNLDELTMRLGYFPLNTATFRQAAVLWAKARQQGLPTADSAALDADVILAAQALQLIGQGNDVVVATTNLKHLSRFIPAQFWKTIIN